MKKIIEVLRLKYAGGLSHAQVAQACTLSKGAVSKYVSLAAAHGLTWPLPEDLDEARLEGLLFPPAVKPAAFAEPDHFGLHQALKRKGVTLQLLWSEYAAVHGERAYRYSPRKTPGHPLCFPQRSVEAKRALYSNLFRTRPAERKWQSAEDQARERNRLVRPIERDLAGLGSTTSGGRGLVPTGRARAARRKRRTRDRPRKEPRACHSFK